MEPKGSQKAAKIDSKGGPQGFKMEYKCMHFGNGSIDFFFVDGGLAENDVGFSLKNRRL